MQLLRYYSFANTIGSAAAPGRKGKDKWINESKGFGFIIPEDGSKDLLVHFCYTCKRYPTQRVVARRREGAH